MKNIFANFSVLSLLLLTTVTSLVNFPVITLNKEIFPTNGSAIVLNTKAENGFSSSSPIKTSSFFLTSIAFCGIEYLR